MRLLLVLFFIGWTCTSFAEHTDTSEASLKAAMLINIMSFVKWPDQAAGNAGSITVCVVGDDATDHALESREGEVILGRKLTVVRLSAKPADLLNCQAVFINGGNPDLVFRVSSMLNRDSVLLLGEGRTSIENGAMVSLIPSAGRMVLEVNLAAARASGVTISSKLLRLARRVVD